ncbi:MAG: DUF2849 domain-containing protein [Alphaproteobacteria bacterium]|nr:DUF2849 domain-containing protein [Alphaproteobacteria bacterium]
MDGTAKKPAAAEAASAAKGTLQVMTAYRLQDGHVVYLADDGTWTEWIEEARLASTKEAADALTAAAKAASDANQIFETYLIDVTTSGGRTWPVTMREVMRAQGPTIHPQFGKQAERETRGLIVTSHAVAKKTERGERRENREG